MSDDKTPTTRATDFWSEHGEILEADMLGSRIHHFLSDARLIPTSMRVLLRDAESALKGYANGQ